jgi:hypothetical protein
MALQKKILKREMTCSVMVDGEEKTFTLSTAALAGGIPGKIYDVAYGPVIHTGNLSAEADIGTYVEGRGVIVNAPEYALVGGLTPSLTLPANTVANFMTAGHIMVKCGAVEDILAGMNARVLFGKDASSADDDLCVVEVNGFKAGAGASV